MTQTLKQQTDDALYNWFENTKHVLCSDKTRSEIVEVCFNEFIKFLIQKRLEIEPLFNIYKETETEQSAKQFYKGMEHQIDKLLTELSFASKNSSNEVTEK